MTAARLLAALGVIVMGLALGNAALNGDFAREGRLLLSNPWGVVSLVDLYVGFSLFCGWIFYREAQWGRALIWAVLVMVLGFFAASLYVWFALRGSAGNWERFWLGHHAD